MTQQNRPSPLDEVGSAMWLAGNCQPRMSMTTTHSRLSTLTPGRATSMTEAAGKLNCHPNGAGEEALAPYRAMSREDLELCAFAAEGRLRAVAETVRHWRGSEERTASQGYIAPFRYSLAELAVTIRNAIFWANWPATEHEDIFAETEAVSDAR